MNDRTTVFLHVPKAAGASLRTLLNNVYGPDRVFWFRPGQRAKSMAMLREMPEAQRAALRVVTGHISFGLVEPVLARPVDYITVLRDPVERLRSFYQFVVETPGHPDHAAVATMDLRAFAKSDVVGIDDLQTRMVSGKTGQRMIGRDVFDLAERNLRAFALVGVQEHYVEFVEALATRLGWDHVPEVPNVHRAGQAMEVDPEARELLLARNRWDSLLHQGVLRAWDRAEPDYSLTGKHGGVDASRAPPDNGRDRDA